LQCNAISAQEIINPYVDMVSHLEGTYSFARANTQPFMPIGLVVGGQTVFINLPPLLHHFHYTSACTFRQLHYEGHVDWRAQPSHVIRQMLQGLEIGGGEAWSTLNGKAIETWLE
jgi:hypothetical protein